MTAYNTIDSPLLAGLENGLLGRKEGGWVCRESAGIDYGQPIFGYKGDQIGAYNFYNDTAKIAFDADFVTANQIDGTVNSVAISPVTFTTDHATTMGLVIAAYEALTGVRAELDTTDGTGRTLLVQTKGAANTSTAVVTLGASQATATITYGSSQIFVGASLYSQNQAKLYEQYDAINVMTDGELWVPVTATVSSNIEAYIDNDGADLGTFSNVGVEISGVYRSNATSGNLALLRVDGQKKMTYADIF